MIKDKILFKGDNFQVSTISKDGILETMIFPIKHGMISGSEVYCFRTFEPSESMEKHEDILYHPEKYLTPSVIQEYLDSKEEDFKMTDLEKCKDFFEDINIEYEVRELPNDMKEIIISSLISGEKVDGAVSFYFKKGDFIEIVSFD